MYCVIYTDRFFYCFKEPATPILRHGIFTDWSMFSTPFLLWKKGSSGLVTQWSQLLSCDWLWHSHGSLIQSRFDLKINGSLKTPWQEYSWVECSYSWAPEKVYCTFVSVSFTYIFIFSSFSSDCFWSRSWVFLWRWYCHWWHCCHGWSLSL